MSFFVDKLLYFFMHLFTVSICLVSEHVHILSSEFFIPNYSCEQTWEQRMELLNPALEFAPWA